MWRHSSDINIDFHHFPKKAPYISTLFLNTESLTNLILIFMFFPTESKPTSQPVTVGACSKTMTATKDKANVGEELSKASVINEPGDCWETCGKTPNCVAANWDPRDPDEPLCTLYSSVTGEEEKNGYQSVKCQQGILVHFICIFLPK